VRRSTDVKDSFFYLKSRDLTQEQLGFRALKVTELELRTAQFCSTIYNKEL
jgi:hypothetical protein